MTYLEFATAVRRQVFPQGEAPNLKAVHSNWIKDALIELQQRIFCLQAKQYDYLVQTATFWNCGATVFEAPRGFINSLKTVSSANQCDEVRYAPTTKDELECLIKEAESEFPTPASGCGCPVGQDPPYQYCVGYDSYDAYGYLLGMRYANSTNDPDCRARSGSFALHDGFIWMYPAIRSDEIAILEWRGIKREWNDADALAAYYDREVSKAVELFLETEAARKEDCDIQKHAASKQAYNDKVGDLIWQCRKERRLPQPSPCFMNCEAWHRCTGKPVAKDKVECEGSVPYYFGDSDPNGVLNAPKNSMYVQVNSAGQAFIFINVDGASTWV